MVAWDISLCEEFKIKQKSFMVFKFMKTMNLFKVLTSNIYLY